MIKIYKNRNNKQYKQIVNWLDDFCLSYRIVTHTGLLYEDLKQILHLSDKGFEEILVSRDRAPKIYKMLPENFFEMSVDEMINFILDNQKLLKSPLVFDNNHLLVGYNSEKIRVFVPRVRGELVRR